MTSRQTSIDAYNEIKNGNLLKTVRLEVYECLYAHGPMTQMELCRKINNPKRQDRSYMPRFAELKDMGVIQEIGQKVCSVTGRGVICWDVTDQLPRKLDSKITESKNEKIKRLEEMVSDLKMHLSWVIKLTKDQLDPGDTDQISPRLKVWIKQSEDLLKKE